MKLRALVLSLLALVLVAAVPSGKRHWVTLGVDDWFERHYTAGSGSMPNECDVTPSCYGGGAYTAPEAAIDATVDDLVIACAQHPYAAIHFPFVDGPPGSDMTRLDLRSKGIVEDLISRGVPCPIQIETRGIDVAQRRGRPWQAAADQTSTQTRNNVSKQGCAHGTISHHHSSETGDRECDWPQVGICSAGSRAGQWCRCYGTDGQLDGDGTCVDALDTDCPSSTCAVSTWNGDWFLTGTDAEVAAEMSAYTQVRTSGSSQRDTFCDGITRRGENDCDAGDPTTESLVPAGRRARPYMYREYFDFDAGSSATPTSDATYDFSGVSAQIFVGSGATTTEIPVSGVTWTPGEWTGGTAYIRFEAESANWEARTITGNGTASVTVSPGFGTAPTAGTVIGIDDVGNTPAVRADISGVMLDAENPDLQKHMAAIPFAIAYDLGIPTTHPLVLSLSTKFGMWSIAPADGNGISAPCRTLQNAFFGINRFTRPTTAGGAGQCETTISHSGAFWHPWPTRGQYETVWNAFARRVLDQIATSYYPQAKVASVSTPARNRYGTTVGAGNWEGLSASVHDDARFAGSRWNEITPTASFPFNTPQCSDGRDNDGDTLIDFPADTGCADATDATEEAPAPSDSITAALAVSKIQGATCVAPCAVHLSAIGTTATTTTNPFHDLEYQWDLGNPAAGTWRTRLGGEKNRPRGPLAGGIFPDAGVYPIKLTVTDGNITGEASSSLTVVSQRAHFGTSGIWCIRATSTGDFRGCPLDTNDDGACSGSEDPSGHCVTQASANTALTSASYCNVDNARAACLFRAGDDFTASGGVSFWNDTGNPTAPGIVGRFGIGPRPKFTGGTGITTNPGWTMYGIHQVLAAASGQMATVSNAKSNVTLWDNKAENVYSGCFATGSGIAASHNRWIALVENECTYGSTSDNGPAVFLRAEDTVVVGNVIDNNSQGEFNFRSVHFPRSVLAHNEFLNPGQTDSGGTFADRNPVQLRAWADASSSTCGLSGQIAPAPTQYVVVADNYSSYAGEGIATMTYRLCQDQLCSSNSTGCGTPQEITDILFERNMGTFNGLGTTAGSSSGARLDNGFVNGQGGRITVRNNVVDMQGVTSAPSSNRLVWHTENFTGCVGCSASDWHVQNNVVYYDEDTNDPLDLCRADAGTGHSCDLNLVWRPNDFGVAGSDVIDSAGSGTWASQTGNLFATTTPFAATPPDRGATLPSDFALSASSDAKNRGTPAQLVVADYGADCRAAGASHDAGAWEQGASTCLVPTSQPVGINSERLDHDEEAIVFADAINNSAQIRTQANPETSTWESFWQSYRENRTTLEAGIAIPVNQRGWPSVDLPYNPSGTPVVAKMQLMKQDAGRPIAYPRGTYTLRFDGTGTVIVGGDAAAITCTGTNASCQVFVEPTTAGVDLFITASDAESNPITNVDLLLPGYTDEHQFYRPFVDKLRAFGFVRGLYFTQANHYPCSNLNHTSGNSGLASCTHTWAGRTDPDGIQATRRGMAWEHQIALAEAAGVDFWPVFPHAATDEYVQQVAALLSASTIPVIYVGPFNEVWNPSFEQYDYFTNVGIAAGWNTGPGGATTNARRRAHVSRVADVVDIFDAEFASEPTRLVRVLDSRLEVSAASETSGLLAALASATYNPTGATVDAVSVNPYFGIEDPSPYANADAYLDAVETQMAATMPGYLAIQYAAIHGAGLRMFAYEGGADFSTASSLLVDASNSSRMEGIVGSLFDLWFAAGGEDAALGFVCRDFQNWGAWRYPDQPIDEAPKARAYMNEINAFSTDYAPPP